MSRMSIRVHENQDNKPEYYNEQEWLDNGWTLEDDSADNSKERTATFTKTTDGGIPVMRAITYDATTKQIIDTVSAVLTDPQQEQDTVDRDSLPTTQYLSQIWDSGLADIIPDPSYREDEGKMQDCLSADYTARVSRELARFLYTPTPQGKKDVIKDIDNFIDYLKTTRKLVKRLPF